jgi:NTP pyrophosphatase (non-canonical NTP hydrolase)
MKISELVTKAYDTAKSKGFHDEDAGITFGDRIALVHSEASEALEEYRKHGHFEEYTDRYAVDKPQGIPSELADIVIRVADMCGVYGIDLQGAIERKLAYNATRPYRHGKVKL